MDKLKPKNKFTPERKLAILLTHAVITGKWGKFKLKEMHPSVDALCMQHGIGRSHLAAWRGQLDRNAKFAFRETGKREPADPEKVRGEMRACRKRVQQVLRSLHVVETALGKAAKSGRKKPPTPEGTPPIA